MAAEKEVCPEVKVDSRPMTEEASLLSSVWRRQETIYIARNNNTFKCRVKVDDALQSTGFSEI